MLFFTWFRLLCLRGFIFSCIITPLFLLLYSCIKLFNSIYSLAFFLNLSFRGVSTEKITFFICFYRFARLMTFYTICSGSVAVFRSFVPQCNMTLLGAHSIVDWMYGSLPRKISKYGVFSGPYFLVFGLNTDIYGINTGKYGPEKLRVWTLFRQWLHILCSGTNK